MAQNVNLNTDPGKLIECGNEIIDKANSYNKEIQNVYTKINDLKSAWTGDRASSFIAAIEKYKGQYEDFGKLIKQLGELVVAVGTDYKNFESGQY